VLSDSAESSEDDERPTMTASLVVGREKLMRMMGSVVGGKDAEVRGAESEVNVKGKEVM
jgi:hypothetical protein